MAGSATLALEQAVLGHTLGFAAMTMPPAVFVGLCQATPVPDASTKGAEVSANGYQRQGCVFALAATPQSIAANTTTVAWPAAAAGWGTVGWFEIWAALAGGIRLYWGPLVDPADGVTAITRVILAGDIIRFPAGVLQVRAI